MLYIVLAIVGFGFLIMMHELGHFGIAKWSGVQVNEFWIGMGPAIFSKSWKGTTYCLRLLPFGGACLMEGEDAESDSKCSFSKASLPKRMMIVLAGALVNFLVGIAILFLVYASPAVQNFPSTTIEKFDTHFQQITHTPLEIGDQILQINGQKILMPKDIAIELGKSNNGIFDFTVKRNHQMMNLKQVKLQPISESPKRYGIYFQMQPKTWKTVFQYTKNTTVSFASQILDGLGALLGGKVGMKEMSGPVGVASAMVQVAKHSILDYFFFLAFISINLGVMNLLPLPALDGGRFVLLCVEAIRGKPISSKKEGLVHFIGFVIIMALILYITGQDILRLF